MAEGAAFAVLAAERRTGVPSARRVPKARASPMPQSMGPPLRAAARVVEQAFDLGVGREGSGQGGEAALTTVRSSSLDTPVGTGEVGVAGLENGGGAGESREGVALLAGGVAHFGASACLGLLEGGVDGGGILGLDGVGVGLGDGCRRRSTGSCRWSEMAGWAATFL